MGRNGKLWLFITFNLAYTIRTVHLFIFVSFSSTAGCCLYCFRLPYPFVKASQTQAAVILRPTNGDFLKWVHLIVALCVLMIISFLLINLFALNPKRERKNIGLRLSLMLCKMKWLKMDICKFFIHQVLLISLTSLSVCLRHILAVWPVNSHLLGSYDVWWYINVLWLFSLWELMNETLG